ncbi:MAG TPA: hypothetical protein VI934_00045 [Candidatus Nanoarchaeia archaeon]|nr:hypothetical protein [Candidatus Nanoarchaeia archaeon]
MKNRTRLKNKPDVVEALKLLAAKYDVENAPSIEEARKILDKASRIWQDFITNSCRNAGRRSIKNGKTA